MVDGRGLCCGTDVCLVRGIGTRAAAARAGRHGPRVRGQSHLSTGAGASEAYPAVLATLIGREVVPAGVPGEVTAAGLRRLPAVLDRERPKLLLLCLGGNDMLQRIDASATAANLRSMVQVARDRGVPVVLIGVPKAPLFSGSVDYFEVIAREFGIPLENEIMASLFYDGSTKSDAVHPNAAGYRRMAEAIAVLLRSAGAVE